MGKVPNDFQDTEYILKRFGKKTSEARKGYRAYLAKGVEMGRRPDLVGGGLVRSAGGWSAVKAMRRAQRRMKGDERILGDGEFARVVLDATKEQFEERYQLRTQVNDLDRVAKRVATILEIKPAQVWAAGKHPLTVKARSLLCYWAVRKLGFTATEVSKRLGVSQPSVSISVKRGEKIATEGQFTLEKVRKL
jgi:hypothetical protein